MGDQDLLNDNQELFLAQMFQPNTLGNSADEIVKILRKKLKKTTIKNFKRKYRNKIRKYLY